MVSIKDLLKGITAKLLSAIYSPTLSMLGLTDSKLKAIAKEIDFPYEDLKRIVLSFNPASLGVNFSMFIFEEAIQAMNFGIYQAMNAGDYELAEKLIKEAQGILDLAVEFSKLGKGLSPITYQAFDAFYTASFYQLQAYKQVVALMLDEKLKPTKETIRKYWQLAKAPFRSVVFPELEQIQFWYNQEYFKLKEERELAMDKLRHEKKRTEDIAKADFKKMKSDLRRALKKKEITREEYDDLVYKLELDLADKLKMNRDAVEEKQKALDEEFRKKFEELYAKRQEKLAKVMQVEAPAPTPTPAPTPPAPPELTATLSSDKASVNRGERIRLKIVVEGGTPPYKIGLRHRYHDTSWQETPKYPASSIPFYWNFYAGKPNSRLFVRAVVVDAENKQTTSNMIAIEVR